MDKKGSDADQHESTGTSRGLRRTLFGCKSWAPVIPVFALMLIGLAVCDVVMEANILSHASEAIQQDTSYSCKPRVVNASTIESSLGHRFYTMLKESAVPAPTFRGNHSWLCKEEWRSQMKFGYCLPISGRKDTPFCTAADRMDLLNSHPTYNSTCYASVLHMLLVEVYEELKAAGNTPLITFGSLLGAVRNGSMIPFTEDTDIGFVGELKARYELQEALKQKGYHMFFFDIWRVCVAPTHPLAGRLYDPSLPITKKFSVPYVDLYKMTKLYNGKWNVEELEGSDGRLLPGDVVEPFSQVTINGMPFDTVHDPNFFLTEAYGKDYMTPKPREDPRVPAAVASKQKLLEVIQRMKEKNARVPWGN
ncbi:hypothetical protein ON010_g8083 [Phytophthora cinnamomi]|nr:hypothetical protein ON010_g8083 [Phytophthora cinnamomi]